MREPTRLEWGWGWQILMDEGRDGGERDRRGKLTHVYRLTGWEGDAIGLIQGLKREEEILREIQRALSLRLGLRDI